MHIFLGFSSSSGWSNPGRCSSWQLTAWLHEPRWTSSGDADSAQRGKQRSWSRRPRRGERSCRRRNDLTPTVSRQVRGVPASVGQCWFDSNCIRPGKRGPILMCQTVSGCWGVTDGQMVWFQLYHARWEGSSLLGSVVVKAIPMQQQFDANCITPGERGPSLLGSVYVEERVYELECHLKRLICCHLCWCQGGGVGSQIRSYDCFYQIYWTADAFVTKLSLMV